MSEGSDEPRPSPGLSRAALGWLLLVVVVAIVVYWPAMSVRYFADDYIQIAKLEGYFGDHSAAGLYTFFAEDPAGVAEHIARGSLPWWTVEDFRFVHLRPLASLLIELDHAIAPRGAYLHHLHSMGWMVAMLVAAFVMLRRAATPWIAGAALLLFSLDEALAWNVAWIANRCALITATFVFAALSVHLRRVEEDRRSLAGIELVCWALAFAAGEYAVCGLAYLSAHTLLGRTDGWKKRAVSLLPALVALLGFSIAYAVVGGGVAGGTSYIDPFSEHSRFLNEVVERCSRTAGEVWLSVGGETEQLWNRYYDTPLPKLFVIWNQDRTTVSLEQAHGRFSFMAVTLIVTGFWLLMRRFLTAGERRLVAWTTVGSILSLVPLAATPPVTRTLVLASLGPAVFVAAAGVAAVRGLRGQGPGPAPTRGSRVRAGVLAALALAAGIQHTAGDVKWARKHIERLVGLGDAFEAFFLNDATRNLKLEGKHVVVLAAPELVSAFYGQWIMNAAGGPVPDTWHTLVMGVRRYIVRRHGKRALEVSALGETLHVSLQETLFRTPARRLGKDDEVDAGLFKAKIVKELPWQGPSAILFSFDRPLDDPSLVFLVAGEHGLEPFAIPPPGKATAIPIPDVPHDESLDDPA